MVPVRAGLPGLESVRWKILFFFFFFSALLCWWRLLLFFVISQLRREFRLLQSTSGGVMVRTRSWIGQTPKCRFLYLNPKRALQEPSNMLYHPQSTLSTFVCSEDMGSQQSGPGGLAAAKRNLLSKVLAINLGHNIVA